MKFAWWPHTTDSRTASYRLRCAQVITALCAQGVDCDEWQPGAAAPSVLILSKRYDRGSLATAEALRTSNGTRLVLDLCDNHFYTSQPSPVWQRRAEDLLLAVSSVDAVVASTDALAEIVLQQCPTANVTVIGDAVELPGALPTRVGLPGAIAEWRLWQLRRNLLRNQIPKERRLVWFGNHGSGYAAGGMADLLSVRTPLEAAHAEAPIHLTVISNSHSKFNELTSGWALPTYYLPWNAGTFSRALQLHSICIIPIGRNPFTICKTSNRAETALLHGLTVVADSIPSYQALSSFTYLDDWRQGLACALSGTSEAHQRTAAGAAYVRKEFTLERIADRWHMLICALEPRSYSSFGG